MITYTIKKNVGGRVFIIELSPMKYATMLADLLVSDYGYRVQEIRFYSELDQAKILVKANATEGQSIDQLAQDVKELSSLFV